MSKDARSDTKLVQKEWLREEANIALENLSKTENKSVQFECGHWWKHLVSDRRPFVGVPVVELGRHDLLEDIYAEVGWEVTANLRALLEPYFRSKSIEGIHYRDLDTEVFFMQLYNVYDAIKRAEREEWSSEPFGGFGSALHTAYELGYTPAAALMTNYCLQTGEPIDDWAHWLLSVLKDKLAPGSKKNMRRPTGGTPKQWLWDLETCVMVDFWKNKVRRISPSGKVDFILGTSAFKLVRAMRFAGTFKPDDVSHLLTIERAYTWTVRRFSAIFIPASQHFRSVNDIFLTPSGLQTENGPITTFRKLLPNPKKA